MADIIVTNQAVPPGGGGVAMNTSTTPLTDAELLDWIERELHPPLGESNFGWVMQYVHAGLPLRQAVQQAIATTSPPGAATALLDRIWRAQIIARRTDNQEVLVQLPDVGSCGWVAATRLTPLTGGVP